VVCRLPELIIRPQIPSRRDSSPILGRKLHDVGHDSLGHFLAALFDPQGGGGGGAGNMIALTEAPPVPRRQRCRQLNAPTRTRTTCLEIAGLPVRATRSDSVASASSILAVRVRQP